MQRPLYRNGYVKIAISFVIMALSFTAPVRGLGVIQFLAGVAYFLLGLKLLLASHAKLQPKPTVYEP